MKILVVEDDASVAQTLQFLLSTYNYAVDISEDGDIGLQMAEAFDYDLILLDVVLPKLDGISLCQTLRSQGLLTPILLLTGQGNRQQKAIALNAGADDYVVKPFDADELIARVQALLRRGRPTSQPILTWGKLSVEPSRCSVTYGTQLLSLTPKEYAILELFLRNPQRALSAKTILDHVWSSVESPGEEAVRVHIKELRQKLTTAGAPKDWIKTVYRVGYQLNPLYSDYVISPSEQVPTQLHVAELTSVNQELRQVLEELQASKRETERQQAKATLAEGRSAELEALNEELQQTLEELRVAEEELRLQNLKREVEQLKYQDLFNFAPDGYLVTDPKGVIQEANHAIIGQLSVPQHYLIGHPLSSFIAKPDKQLFYHRLRQLKTQTWTVTLRSRKGNPFPAEIKVAPIYTANTVTGLRWLIRDISDRQRVENERKQLEISLQTSESKLSQIVDSVFAAIVNFRFFDNHTWEYDYFSVGCELLFGYTVQELMADKTLWLSKVHPEDYDRILMPLYDDFFTERAVSAEYRFYHKDGSIRWIFSAYTPRQTSPRCCTVTVINHDITDRKRLEEERQQVEVAIQKREEQVRLALELTHMGSWYWHFHPPLLLWNDNHYRLFGYEPQEFEPTYEIWRNCLHPQDREAVERDLVYARENQTDFEAEYRIVLKDGSIRWMLDRGRGIYNDAGEAVQMIGVLFDITDRKHAELALQQQIAREQLIAEISQDIRRSLDLNDVLSQTVERVRQVLAADRVIIFKFRPDWRGDVIMESVGDGWMPMISHCIFDPCFRDRYAEPYRQGRMDCVSDVDQVDFDPCYLDFLKQFQVKANLITPILQGQNLWGLLVAHQCSAPRNWQPSECELFRQLATQVGIAIQQSELYQQTRRELLERERVQAVLEESEERFRTLSAAAPIGIRQTDASGICLYTNVRWQEMSGLSFEDSLGNGWLQAVHPNDRKALFAAWNAYVEGDRNELPEFRLLTPSGEIRWVSARVAAIQSASGEITGYVSADEDITERKQTEQKIREQATLLDIASDAIFVHDLNHHILYWNRGAERLYGWQAAEVIGQPVNEVLQEDAAQIATIEQALFAHGEWQGEASKVTKTGQVVMTACRLTLVRDESGQPKFILAVNTDITQKRQLEIQFYRAQRLESLGTLASGVAHDLNNVLTPVLTISQLLIQTQSNLNQRSHELLHVLEESAKRGAKMVKQILTFVQGSNSDRVSLRVDALLEDVVKIAQQIFPKSISIRYEPSDEGLGLVSADPTHLHQVLMNLCVNARDAMPDGGVLTLTAQNCWVDHAFAQCSFDAQVGDYVVVTVSDTGTGIAPELRDRIFEPFFTTKQPGQGTGLGLSTVLGIVKSYGGFLHVSSKVGQGTQIMMYLPVTDEVLVQKDAPEIVLHGNDELILVVDDDDAVQQTTHALLESHHYRALLANDGTEAIACYAKHQAKISVVLMDVMMPNMDGITAIRTLKKMNSNIKIIALSGLVTHKDATLAAGANVFLVKPFRTKDLLQNLHNLINTSV